jgi:hypothetical protein
MRCSRLGKKYGVLIFVLILLVAGTGISVLNYFYPFEIINNFLFRQNYSLDPDVELNPEKKYVVTLWYPPFYRTIPKNDGDKQIMELIKDGVEKVYPNIQLKLREIGFADIKGVIERSFEEGNPPDIYFNTENNIRLNSEYQVPVERYLVDEELPGFYTVNWEEIKRRNQHLWGWPFLVQKQGWLSNFNINNEGEVSHLFHLNNILQMNKAGIILNYYDDTLLRQLFAIEGIHILPVGRTGLTNSFYTTFKNILYWSDTIKNKYQITSKKTEKMIKLFLSKEKIALGPANIWLEYYLKSKDKSYTKLKINGQIRYYSLNIFYQKNNKESDEVKASMEVGKYITKEFSQKVADILQVSPGYRNGFDKGNYVSETSHQIMQIPVDRNQIWRKKVWPAWIAFWEEGLTPEEVIKKIRNN